MLLKKRIKNYIRNVLNLKKLFNKPVPIYTDKKILNEGIKLHLGCGDVNLQGWINIDGRNDEHVHVVSQDLSLSAFSDNSISEIYICHVLEHFSYEEANNLIRGFTNKLLNRGILRVSVPDFDKLIDIYNANDKNLESIRTSLMGGQNYNLNFHKSTYNKNYLISLLKKNGFKNCSEWDTISDFGRPIGDFSDSKIKTKKGYIPISLNLKAEIRKV